jgi:hypothetical protein
LEIKQDTIGGYVCKKATVNYAGRGAVWYNQTYQLQLVPIISWTTWIGDDAQG